MKIDVTYEAMLRTLVEAIRDERDHGRALMSLVSRLVDEAGRQDWFEAHWKTDARLKLAQMACGDMPQGWRSAAPVLDLIGEAARWALKGDDMDSDGRATLYAIARLAGGERSGRSTTESKARPAVKPTRRRKAGARRGAAAQPIAPAAAAKPKAAKKARPATKSAEARKLNGAAKASTKRTMAKSIKTAASVKTATAKKARPSTKSARARKMSAAAKASTKRITAQPSNPAASAKPMAVKKARPAKVTRARKTKVAAPASKQRPTVQLAKAAGSPQPKPVAKPQPAALPAATSNQANGLGQTSRASEAPASAT
jgi:hypothetical protein